MIRQCILMLPLISLFSPLAQAQTLYKWVDARGVITYQGHPPPAGIKNTQVIETRSKKIYKVVDRNGNVTFQDHAVAGEKIPGLPTTPTDPATVSVQPGYNPLAEKISPAADSTQQAVAWTLTGLLTLAMIRILSGAKVRAWVSNIKVARHDPRNRNS